MVDEMVDEMVDFLLSLNLPSHLSSHNLPSHNLPSHYKIVSYPLVRGDYSSVLPLQRNIDLLKDLKSSGHYIIIYTARRMRTHQVKGDEMR